jgi:hypothetical protein
MGYDLRNDNMDDEMGDDEVRGSEVSQCQTSVEWERLYLSIRTQDCCGLLASPYIWVLTPNTNGKVDQVGRPIGSQLRRERDYTIPVLFR